MKLKAERLQAKKNLIGAGLRHAHFPTLLEKPQITTNWFEVISENFMGLFDSAEVRFIYLANFESQVKSHIKLDSTK